MLVRPGSDAPEIFMVKRHEKASFGSSYAFPGGVLESTDACVHERSTGVSEAQAKRLYESYVEYGRKMEALVADLG